jgi:hypothetical protein
MSNVLERARNLDGDKGISGGMIGRRIGVWLGPQNSWIPPCCPPGVQAKYVAAEEEDERLMSTYVEPALNATKVAAGGGRWQGEAPSRWRWRMPCRSIPDAPMLDLLCFRLPRRARACLVLGCRVQLLALFVAKKLDALNRLAAVAAPLGSRLPAHARTLLGFNRRLAGRSDAAALIRRLDCLAAATTALYAQIQTPGRTSRSRRGGNQRLHAQELDLRESRPPARARRTASCTAMPCSGHDLLATGDPV